MLKNKKINLPAVIGIAAIVLVCLLLLIPGFVNLGTQNTNFNNLNGYEFFMNVMVRDGKTYYPAAFCVGSVLPKDEAYMLPAAIALIIIFVGAIVSFCLVKKSSALLLLGGLLDVAASVFFFAMEANAAKFYNVGGWVNATVDKIRYYDGRVSWISYFCGAILVLAGAYAIYKSIKIMIAESKAPSANKAPSYNYLKK